MDNEDPLTLGGYQAARAARPAAAECQAASFRPTRSSTNSGVNGLRGPPSLRCRTSSRSSGGFSAPRPWSSLSAWLPAPGRARLRRRVPIRADARSGAFPRSLWEPDLGSSARALALWRGSPLADFTFEPFAQAEIRRLEGLHASALEDRIDADLECGRQSELIGELESLVAAHPLREGLRSPADARDVSVRTSGRVATALPRHPPRARGGVQASSRPDPAGSFSRDFSVRTPGSSSGATLESSGGEMFTSKPSRKPPRRGPARDHARARNQHRVRRPPREWKRHS